MLLHRHQESADFENLKASSIHRSPFRINFGPFFGGLGAELRVDFRWR
jgi:hypothetical protein